MEVLLKKDIDRLGNKDEIVTVKNGFGRNYLIPKGIAVLATESVKKCASGNSQAKGSQRQSIERRGI